MAEPPASPACPSCRGAMTSMPAGDAFACRPCDIVVLTFCPDDHVIAPVFADQPGRPLILEDLAFCDDCGVVQGPKRRKVFL